MNNKLDFIRSKKKRIKSIKSNIRNFKDEISQVEEEIKDANKALKKIEKEDYSEMDEESEEFCKYSIDELHFNDKGKLGFGSEMPRGLRTLAKNINNGSIRIPK